MEANMKDDHRDYAWYLLAGYCIPTLLKMKPASMFRISKKSIKNICKLLDRIETEIKQYGCRYECLFEDSEVLILLIYNTELLNRIIFSRDNKLFLKRWGYDFYENSISRILSVLKIRFDSYYRRNSADREPEAGKLQKQDFPHEIGIILGYPLSDVEDFIKYQGKNYILCGCWKVYHNVEDAARIFSDYQRVKENALCMLQKGKALRDIINSKPCKQQTNS
jgi:hypothetical protein